MARPVLAAWTYHGIDMTLDKQACILAVSEPGPVTFIHRYDFNTGWLMALPIADIATV